MSDRKEESCNEQNTNHTFAVCAYQISPYLEQCLCSVINQTRKSNVIISTSTPNDHIFSIAKKYGLSVLINEDKTAGMQDNWNFAVSQAKTDFVTVCHQDDYYHERYFETIEPFLSFNVLMIHTAYFDVINGNLKRRLNNRIKAFNNRSLTCTARQASIKYKTNALRFGNSVCCPSCTYNLSLLGMPIFKSPLKHACDWDLYINLAQRDGRVVYIDSPLTYKRIHVQSSTKNDIVSGIRAQEDLILFKRLWPEPIAVIFAKLFKIIYYYG